VAQPLRDFLLPEQLGISVSGGCEHALHIVEAHLAARPDDVILKVDMKNAFNQIDRRIADRIIEHAFPELKPLMTLSYGPHGEGAPRTNSAGTTTPLRTG